MPFGCVFVASQALVRCHALAERCGHRSLRRCEATMRFLFYPTIYTRTVGDDGPYKGLHHRLCHPERSRRISNFSAVFCTSILLRLRTRLRAIALRRCEATMRFLFCPTIYTRTVEDDGPYEVFVYIRLRRGQNGFKIKTPHGIPHGVCFYAVSP